MLLSLPHLPAYFHRKKGPIPSEDAGTAVSKPEQIGLLVTAELEKALEECKAKVARIAKQCRAQNRRFRDVEFDLDKDQMRCLNGLNVTNYKPASVRRVTQIFEKPEFFIDGATANDIVQGALGDCWFLSALATMSTSKGLIDRSCVARDEEVGVYGFIFFRDSRWVTVVTDDLLYTRVPKYEELSHQEKHLYHFNKDLYNVTARKEGKNLYFARSGTTGETWVPLIEKAYAKLHGDYASLSGGYSGEAIEDLTGGVTTYLSTKDILDPERFWKEELLHASENRLFACAFNTLDSSRHGEPNPRVSGLVGGHAYSVLRAVEHKGKKFVVVRNPWGESEWTGPWSDGSAEWKGEWLEALGVLGHVFGDDGQFVMEYKDFLGSFDDLERTRIFGPQWTMSSHWVEVPVRPLPCSWSYGDVSFTITLDKPSTTVIVLSRLDDRYFSQIKGRFYWSFDFTIFKKGEKEPLLESPTSWMRSENFEIALEAGEYVIHVRLDRTVVYDEDYFENSSKNWDRRKLSRVLSERATSQSIAVNFRSNLHSALLPRPLEGMAGKDIGEITAAEAAAHQAKVEAMKKREMERAAKKNLRDAPATSETEAKIDEKKSTVDGGDGKTVEEAHGADEAKIAADEDGEAIEEANCADQAKSVVDKDDEAAREAHGTGKAKAVVGQDSKGTEGDYEANVGEDGETVGRDRSEGEAKVAVGKEDSKAKQDDYGASKAKTTVGKGFEEAKGGAGYGYEDEDEDDRRSESATDSGSHTTSDGKEHHSEPGKRPPSPPPNAPFKDLSFNSDSVFLGLRVYCDTEARAVIASQLRYDLFPPDSPPMSQF